MALRQTLRLALLDNSIVTFGHWSKLSSSVILWHPLFLVKETRKCCFGSLSSEEGPLGPLFTASGTCWVSLSSLLEQNRSLTVEAKQGRYWWLLLSQIMGILRVSSMPRGKWECSGMASTEFTNVHWPPPYSQPPVVWFLMLLASLFNCHALIERLNGKTADLHCGPLLASPSDKCASGWKILKYSSRVSCHHFGRSPGSNSAQPPRSAVFLLPFSKPFLSVMMRIFLWVQLPAVTLFLASLCFLWWGRHLHSGNSGSTRGLNVPLTVSEGRVYTFVHPIRSSGSTTAKWWYVSVQHGYRAEQSHPAGQQNHCPCSTDEKVYL